MSDTTKYFYDYAEAEFNGRSFNGESLMGTLGKLGSEAAASRATHEGYSAWSVAIHVAWCKYFLATSLLGAGGAAALGDFPWAHGEDGFGEPVEVSERAWKEALAYLGKVHAAAAAAIRAAGPEDLARTMPVWGIPFGQAIAWYLGHDGYHAAQIRNMGVPGLREVRRV